MESTKTELATTVKIVIFSVIYVLQTPITAASVAATASTNRNASVRTILLTINYPSIASPVRTSVSDVLHELATAQYVRVIDSIPRRVFVRMVSTKMGSAKAAGTAI